MIGKNKNTMATAGTKTKVSTVLGEGTVFDGNLKTSGTVRVDGTVNGNCTSDEEMILGPEGVVKGNVSAKNIIISGRVDGDITSLGKLEILSTGKACISSVLYCAAQIPLGVPAACQLRLLYESSFWIWAAAVVHHGADLRACPWTGGCALRGTPQALPVGRCPAAHRYPARL